MNVHRSNKSGEIHHDISELNPLIPEQKESINYPVGKAREYVWQSGCFKFDSRVMSFCSQVIITFIIIVFCMVQLIRLTDCNSQQVYIGILTLVIGVWIDTPRFRKKSGSEQNDPAAKSFTWYACRLEFDSRALFFFTQLIVSIGVIAFCIFQLISHNDCHSQQAYIGILTLVIGVWIDAPRFG